MHLYVGIWKVLEVEIEVCSESLSLRLLFEPMFHAYIPGVIVIVTYYTEM